VRKIRFNFHLSDEYDKYLIEFIQSHKNQSRIIRDLLRAGYTALQQKNTEKTDIPKDIPDNTNEPLIITTESTLKGIPSSETIYRTLDTPKNIQTTKKESSTEPIQWKIPVK